MILGISFNLPLAEPARYREVDRLDSDPGQESLIVQGPACNEVII